MRLDELIPDSHAARGNLQTPAEQTGMMPIHASQRDSLPVAIGCAEQREAHPTRYFRGERVPQDPNDEPAAELLKRIQAVRQTQAPSNRQRKPAV